jgi:hypothetical protein
MENGSAPAAAGGARRCAGGRSLATGEHRVRDPCGLHAHSPLSALARASVALFPQILDPRASYPGSSLSFFGYFLDPYLLVRPES